jgi:hypothetical protein
MQIDSNLVEGFERLRLDGILSGHIDLLSRQSMWKSVDNVLNKCVESIKTKLNLSGIVLGYVQSGKTTAITSLMAGASDNGIQIIVSLLGTTNLLLEQNSSRISESLGIGSRSDYRWVELEYCTGVCFKNE